MSHTDEELLRYLREFSDKYNRPPTSHEISADESAPSPSPYYTRFGSWNAALEAAGLTPKNAPNPEYTDEELVDPFRKFADEHGRPPTTGEVQDNDAFPDPSTYYNHFESWSMVIKAAGLNY